MNARLGLEALIIGEQNARFRGGIGRIGQTGRMGVANGGFQIAALVFQDFLDLLLEPMVFRRADFSADGEQRTPQDTAVFFANFNLKTIAKITVFAQAIEGFLAYAINGGNDLGGMFLTQAQAAAAQKTLRNKSDWPYFPKDELDWYGQYH